MWCMTYELFCLFFGCMLVALIPISFVWRDLYRVWRRNVRMPVSRDQQNVKLSSLLLEFVAGLIITSSVVGFFWLAFVELYKARC